MEIYAAENKHILKWNDVHLEKNYFHYLSSKSKSRCKSWNEQKSDNIQTLKYETDVDSKLMR